MNERIRQLAEQAVKDVDIVTGNELPDDELAKMYIPDCFSEKFAELIVREVTNIVLHYTDVDEGVTVAKKHFGVEE